MLELFTNREISLFVWIVGGLAIMLLRYPKNRRSAYDLLRAAFAPKILVVVALFVGYVAILTWLGRHFITLTPMFLKTLIVWTSFSGLSLIFRVGVPDDDSVFLKSIFRDQVSLAIAIGAVADLHSFPLWTELLLIVPAGLFLSALYGYSSVRAKDAQVNTLVGWTLSIVGTVLISHSLWRFGHSFEPRAIRSFAGDFLLPLLFSTFTIPALFMIQAYAVYDTVFVTVDLSVKDPRLRRYAKLELVKRWGMNIRGLKKWNKCYPFGGAATKEEIRARIHE